MIMRRELLWRHEGRDRWKTVTVRIHPLENTVEIEKHIGHQSIRISDFLVSVKPEPMLMVTRRNRQIYRQNTPVVAINGAGELTIDVAAGMTIDQKDDLQAKLIRPPSILLIAGGPKNSAVDRFRKLGFGICDLWLIDPRNITVCGAECFLDTMFRVHGHCDVQVAVYHGWIPNDFSRDLIANARAEIQDIISQWMNKKNAGKF